MVRSPDALASLAAAKSGEVLALVGLKQPTGHGSLVSISLFQPSHFPPPITTGR